MAKETIRVVIRQPLHNLIKEWADILGVDDFGEVVNFLLLDLKRNGNLPNKSPAIPQQTIAATQSDDEDLAGLF